MVKHAFPLSLTTAGGALPRGLLMEATQSAVQHEPEMHRAYQRLAQRKCRGLAKVAMARKPSVLEALDRKPTCHNTFTPRARS